MKLGNNKSYVNYKKALMEAFEKGYMLGKEDAKEGIFIDVKTVVDKSKLIISDKKVSH